MGHRVAHISTPFSLVHFVLGRGSAERREAAARGAHLDDGVTEFIPRPLLPADALWSVRQYRTALRDAGIPDPDYVFIDQPLFAVPDFGDSVVILRPTDIFPSSLLQARASRILRVADGVAATSQKVLEEVTRGHTVDRTVVLENGVDLARFTTRDGPRTGPDFVYVGALDERFDFAGLRLLASHFPERTFHLYGPEPRERSGFDSNVEFRGPVAYEDVPAILADAHVGLLPFTATPLNMGRSPMKLYEYLAAGLAVLAPGYLAKRAATVDGVYAYDPEVAGSMTDAAASALSRNANAQPDLSPILKMDWANVASELMSFADSCQR